MASELVEDYQQVPGGTGGQAAGGPAAAGDALVHEGAPAPRVATARRRQAATDHQEPGAQLGPAHRRRGEAGSRRITLARCQLIFD